MGGIRELDFVIRSGVSVCARSRGCCGTLTWASTAARPASSSRTCVCECARAYARERERTRVRVRVRVREATSSSCGTGVCWRYGTRGARRHPPATELEEPPPPLPPRNGGATLWPARRHGLLACAAGRRLAPAPRGPRAELGRRGQGQDTPASRVRTLSLSQRLAAGPRARHAAIP